MNSINPEASVIIVNWNVRDYLRRCIDSVVATCKDLAYEIIVVDNASSDGSVQMLKVDYPWVKIIENNLNLGFAKANNQGFGISKGKYLVFLNPDTLVYENAFQLMIKYLKQNPKVGWVGPTLLNEDGSIQGTPREVDTLRHLISKLLYIPRIIKKLKSKKPLTDPIATEVLWGACMIIPREVFEKAGLFSENYFMYKEDVDLCYKILSKGYQIHWYPLAKVLHYGGRSTVQRSVDPTFKDVRFDAYYQFYVALKRMKGTIYAKFWALLSTYFALKNYALSLLKIRKPHRVWYFKNQLDVLIKALCERQS